MDSLTTLTRLGGGKFLEDLAAMVTDVAQDVVRTGNKGGVSATITLEKQGDDPMVIVVAKVQAKPPAEKPQTTLFYAVDGDLYRDDP